MASRNRFAAIAIDDEDDDDVFDELQLQALAYLAAPAPAGLVGHLADAAAANHAAAILAAANNPASNNAAANNPAPEAPVGEDGIFHGDALNNLLLDDEDPLNPWKVVTYKTGKNGVKATHEDTTQATVDAYNDSQPAVDGIDAKLCVEVPWEAKTGTLRAVRMHSQKRKGGYVPTAEGPGVYIYGSFGPDRLEF